MKIFRARVYLTFPMGGEALTVEEGEETMKLREAKSAFLERFTAVLDELEATERLALTRGLGR